MTFNKCFPCMELQKELIIKLDCSNTILTDVFPDVWEYERTLEELYLTATRINTLPPQLFYCQSLRILMVNNNNLETIPNAIGTLRHLQHLNLSRNLISNVPDSIKTCKNLTHLDLSCNSLQRLPDSITCLITLEELLLNETSLEFLPANFGRLINLRILELRLNNLLTLPKTMARFTNLQRIDIGGNDFTELPDVIGELKQLRELWIDFNHIRHITPSVAKLCELQHFEANGNFINVLPMEISHWRNIEVLSISTNLLVTLPFSIGMMKALVTLKCEGNELHELPDSIAGLENLEELVISHNKLLRLPTTIGMLHRLRFLFVENNQLHTLPDELCNCKNLSVLSISSNHICELPQHIGRLTKLKVLNLVHNRIVTLPVSILSLINLTSLWISDNQSQPLVPLQYLDSVGARTQLTCFMLPQVGNIATKQQQYSDCQSQNVIKRGDHDDDNNDDVEHRIIGNGTSVNERCQQQQHHQEDQDNTVRRICFAEETIILRAPRITKTAIPIHKQYQKQPHRQQPQPHFDQIGNILMSDDESSMNGETRLMRSPTPYPEELRLMSKYLRDRINNGGKQLRKEATTSRIKETGRGKNINANDRDCSIWTDAAANVTVLYDNAQYLNKFYAEQLQSSRTTVKAQQPQQQVKAHSLTVPTQVSVSALASVSPAPHQFIVNPPPYHIARVLSKKTTTELCNFETMRHQCNQQQTQSLRQQLPYYYNFIDTESNEIALAADEYAAAKIKSNFIPAPSKNVRYDNAGHTSSSWTIDSDDANSRNSVDGLQQKQTLNNSFCIGAVRVESVGINDTLTQLSICSSESITNNKTAVTLTQQPHQQQSFVRINRRNATAWLFGVHRNPTVKQITLKWENTLGFDIKMGDTTTTTIAGNADGGNSDGIYIATVIPNTNAARLLCIDDKLLEFDSYDFSTVTLKQANDILAKCSPCVNIMLSRK